LCLITVEEDQLCVRFVKEGKIIEHQLISLDSLKGDARNLIGCSNSEGDQLIFTNIRDPKFYLILKLKNDKFHSTFKQFQYKNELFHFEPKNYSGNPKTISMSSDSKTLSLTGDYSSMMIDIDSGIEICSLRFPRDLLHFGYFSKFDSEIFYTYNAFSLKIYSISMSFQLIQVYPIVTDLLVVYGNRYLWESSDGKRIYLGTKGGISEFRKLGWRKFDKIQKIDKLMNIKFSFEDKE
jgi:hypothetical protein